MVAWPEVEMQESELQSPVKDWTTVRIIYNTLVILVLHRKFIFLKLAVYMYVIQSALAKMKPKLLT